MTDPVDHLRQVLAHHRVEADDQSSGVACSCGAQGLSDHPRHVAQEIVDRLGLRREGVSREIRYVSAWFDDELTKLEGAE
jgi:hypothetical protein